MARILTDHDAVEDWVAARGGRPVMVSTPQPTGGTLDVVQLDFPQPGARLDVLDDAQGEATTTMSRVEWRDWFAVFDRENLALEVGDRTAGELDSDHRIVKRPAD